MMTRNAFTALSRRRGMGWMAGGALVAAAALMLAVPASASAGNYRTNVTAGMTLAGAPLAIHGYDVVAYFTEGKARLGSAAFTATHDGAAYRFVSEVNKENFEKNPERYAPQYGGFCAFGVALGAKFDGDPTLFRIVDEKLYLNLNPDIQVNWGKDISGNIAKADQNWKKIRDKAPADLK